MAVERSNPNSTLANTPAPYAGGQVATGQQLGFLGNRGVMDTPFNATSYTSKLIQDQQATTLADVLDNDPSIRSSAPVANNFRNEFNIRGFTYYNDDVAFNGLYGVLPADLTLVALRPRGGAEGAECSSERLLALRSDQRGHQYHSEAGDR